MLLSGTIQDVKLYDGQWPDILAHLNSAALLPLSPHAGSEIFPSDFVALAPVTQLASFYHYKRGFEGYYFNGQRTCSAEVNANTMILACSRYGQTARLDSSWSVILPWLF